MGHQVYNFNTVRLETVPKNVIITNAKSFFVQNWKNLKESERIEDERDKIFGRQPIIQINHPKMIKNGSSNFEITSSSKLMVWLGVFSENIKNLTFS